MTDAAPLLSVENLDISFTNYGRRQDVLRKVSLKVAKGERVALIGETGSGKSLTAKAILGTLPDSARIEGGRIAYRGADLALMPPNEREALKGTAFSIIMQDPLSSFNPVFRIGQHLDDVMKYADIRLGRPSNSRDRKARIFDVLRQVQLADPQRVIGAYPSQLSGGMRQRVLIALALLHQPELLIADEPGTALDVTTQDEIIRLINNLVDQNGLSLLMITHNLGVVRQTADQVFVMRHGEIVESGPLARIFDAPQSEYTRTLMEAIPPLYGPRVIDQPPVEGETIISLDRVGKIYEQRSLLSGTRRFEAVRDVSLSIRTGEIFGLAGESGSGKTTLARMIMGMIAPTSGTLSVAGRAHADWKGDRAFQRMTQIVYQNPGTSLNPKRTVEQTLGVPLSFAGIRGTERKARLAELLAQVDLPIDYLGKYPHQLSGGQKQRVAIARALAANPRIIVLDEPTSALDVSVQRNVIALLQRLRDQLGITYLFISHDLSLMRNFCSRVAVMLKGEIVEQGPPATVFTAPTHPYTRALISAIPVMSQFEEDLKPKVSADEKAQFLVQTSR